MRYDELKEGPQYVPTELPVKMGEFRPFVSQDTIIRDYEVIGSGTLGQDEFQIILKTSKSSAIIGVKGNRPLDNKPGLVIRGIVDFKTPLKLTGVTNAPSLNSPTLQVSLVEVQSDRKAQGWGFELYLGLAKAGYTVISDNTQYVGGKALWKKIAAQAVNSQYRVYVLDDGVVRCDADSNPIYYDGANIDEAELWSENTDRKYTLFALTL